MKPNFILLLILSLCAAMGFIKPMESQKNVLEGKVIYSCRSNLSVKSLDYQGEELLIFSKPPTDGRNDLTTYNIKNKKIINFSVDNDVLAVKFDEENNDEKVHYYHNKYRVIAKQGYFCNFDYNYEDPNYKYSIANYLSPNPCHDKANHDRSKTKAEVIANCKIKFTIDTKHALTTETFAAPEYDNNKNPIPVTTINFDKNGNRLAVAYKNGTIRILQLTRTSDQNGGIDLTIKQTVQWASKRDKIADITFASDISTIFVGHGSDVIEFNLNEIVNEISNAETNIKTKKSDQKETTKDKTDSQNKWSIADLYKWVLNNRFKTFYTAIGIGIGSYALYSAIMKLLS